jgi:hypothetical protein
MQSVRLQFVGTDRAVAVITNHSKTEAEKKKLFLYLALHNTHAPFQVPAAYSDIYNYSWPLQKTWAGMVSMVCTPSILSVDPWVTVAI